MRIPQEVGGTKIEPVGYVIIFQTKLSIQCIMSLYFVQLYLIFSDNPWSKSLALMDWHSLRWPVAVMMWSCRVRSQGRSVCTLWLADTPLLWSPVMSSWLAANTCRNTSCYFVLLAVCSSFTLTTISRIFFKPYSSLLGGFFFFSVSYWHHLNYYRTLKFHLLY